MVVDLQCVVAGGDGPVLRETVEQSFDPIALPVGRPVEARAPAGFRPATWDHRPNPAATQRLAHRLAATADVRAPVAGPIPGPATA